MNATIWGKGKSWHTNADDTIRTANYRPGSKNKNYNYENTMTKQKTKRKKESDKSCNREETIVKMIENTCWIDIYIYMLVKAEYPKPENVESTYIWTIMQTQKGEKSRYIFITIYIVFCTEENKASWDLKVVIKVKKIKPKCFNIDTVVLFTFSKCNSFFKRPWFHN